MKSDSSPEDAVVTSPERLLEQVVERQREVIPARSLQAPYSGLPDVAEVVGTNVRDVETVERSVTDYPEAIETPEDPDPDISELLDSEQRAFTRDHEVGPCSDCEGGGTVTCPECYSSDTRSCPACHSGSPKCRECDGDGLRRIRQEYGVEKRQCVTCDGQGTFEDEDCDRCDGTGSLDNCRNCDDGRVECATCEGYGNTYSYTLWARDVNYRIGGLGRFWRELRRGSDTYSVTQVGNAVSFNDSPTRFDYLGLLDPRNHRLPAFSIGSLLLGLVFGLVYLTLLEWIVSEPTAAVRGASWLGLLAVFAFTLSTAPRIVFWMSVLYAGLVVSSFFLIQTPFNSIAELLAAVGVVLLPPTLLAVGARGLVKYRNSDGPSADVSIDLP